MASQMAAQIEESKARAQQQTQLLAEQMSAQMEAIAEKISATPEVNNAGAGNSANKSRAKGRHPEKIERDIDYASFLQWEKA